MFTEVLVHCSTLSLWYCEQKSSLLELLYKNMSLQISQNNTCARVSFLIELLAYSWDVIKKRLRHRCVLVNFAKILRIPFNRILGNCFCQYFNGKPDFHKLVFFRSSHGRCSVEKGVLKDFQKFTGNTCARVSFLIKLLALAFSTEHLGTTASESST